MRKKDGISTVVTVFATCICSVFCALFPLNPISWTITAMIASVLAYIYLTEKKSAIFIYAIPAYFISFALTGQWGISVYSIVSLPVALLLILSVNKGMKRTSSIALMSGGGAFYIISGTVIAAYDVHGSLSVPLLISDTQKGLTAFTSSMALLMPRIESVRLTGEEIDIFARLVFYSSPALLVLIAMFISFIATVFIKLWLKFGKVYYEYFSNDWGIRANFTAALMYIFAALTLALTAFDGINAYFITALNIVVVLTPLMFIVGIKKIVSLIIRRDSVVLTIAAISALIITSAINLLIPIIIISVYGVSMIIMSGLRLIVLTNLR